MNKLVFYLRIGFTFFMILFLNPRIQAQNSTEISLDRIFRSSDFRQERLGPVQWLDGGNAYTRLEASDLMKGGFDLVKVQLNPLKSTTLVSASQFIPANGEQALKVESYSWSNDQQQLLIFTNSKKVWRSNTKGDYWLLDIKSKALRQIGTSLPPSSLMFAKFSPDNQQIAYVSGFNLYTEDLKSGKIQALTKDGNGKIINGTFDWVYEEELGCRDGFRWSPDGTKIAFWQLDASKIKDYYLLNTTDDIYSHPIPVQYPKVGENPSNCKVGVIDLESLKINWLQIPGDDQQHYLPRMQWVGKSEVLVQQLNRRQNKLEFWKCDAKGGSPVSIYTETDKAWVEIDHPDASLNYWQSSNLVMGAKGKSFFRLSEQDGWRHLWKISLQGKATLLTDGEYDVASPYGLDDSQKQFYFNASPAKATERYLYRCPTQGGPPERITPVQYTGVNTYRISPNGQYAIHSHSSLVTAPSHHLISLPDHKILQSLVDNAKLQQNVDALALPKPETFQVTTSEGTVMDGVLFKPANFDPSKKYPILFHVYGEPWGTVANNSWPAVWHRLVAQKGYLVVAMDNRGTPSLKGSAWRKCIYKKVGLLNTNDQALASREVLQWDFVDPERVGVWGWSGGGSLSLHLLFKHPEIYKTAIAVASLPNPRYYDNVYQERYMGLLKDNASGYRHGAAMNYAHNLEGNLLLVHGTGDDNVHYQGVELLINELVKNNKQFSLMAYPNRSHRISEGRGTSLHLYTLMTNYLLKNL